MTFPDGKRLIVLAQGQKGDHKNDEKVILPSRKTVGMTYITAETDYGEKKIFEKWNGKFLYEGDLNEIIHVTENTAIIRPDSILKGAGEVIAYM